MPRELFEEWLAFFRLSPPTGKRIDKAAGIIAHTDYSINCDKSSKGEKWKIDDFEPIWFECDSPIGDVQTPEQIAQAGDMWCDVLKLMREKK